MSEDAAPRIEEDGGERSREQIRELRQRFRDHQAERERERQVLVSEKTSRWGFISGAFMSAVVQFLSQCKLIARVGLSAHMVFYCKGKG